MTSQSGYQTTVLQILPNISRSRGNKKMKFDQLIECNMRNIFLAKSYTKCVRETSPRPSSEKLNLRISLVKRFKVLYSLLVLYVKLRAIEIY